MDTAGHTLTLAHELYIRANTTSSNGTSTTNSANKNGRPPVYKAIGISLAIASGVFIGISFVLKKTGLLKANVKYNEEAGEGYGYLKNALWWTGMTLMIIGEICNFVAYAFVDAILVTPLGALSVVITTILSAIFLKERLSFVGKIGCFNCIIGSVVIVMNAPGQSSAATIQEMKHFVIAPGFLSYAGVVILSCTFIALWVGPRYGKKSMLVYLTICSLIGGLSVVATQGLGAAVVAQASGKPQFNQWFLYVLFVFVILTLVTEIIFLNKALNLFNAALVTPTYYVIFTSSTIVTSAILFRGFKGTPTSITTVVMGFLQICAGVILLQLSKSAKDVPDAAVFKGDLDQVRTVAEQEEPESEPKADAIRGTAGILRSFSNARQKWEADEARRVHEERLKDQMEPIGENEQVEWDGLRRRKTVLDGTGSSLNKRKTMHPPLGMTHFPDENELDDSRPPSSDVHGGSGFTNGRFMSSFKRRTKINRTPSQALYSVDSTSSRPVNEILVSGKSGHESATTPTAHVLPHYQSHDGSMEMDHVYGLPPSLQGQAHDPALSPMQQNNPIKWADNLQPRASASSKTPSGALAPTPPPHSTIRQFSFQNVFHRHRNTSSPTPPTSPPASTTTTKEHPKRHSRHPSSSHFGLPIRPSSEDAPKAATEEERLGLVKGDSRIPGPAPDYQSDDDDDGYFNLEDKSRGGTRYAPLVEEKESESGESESIGERGKGRDLLRLGEGLEGREGGGGGEGRGGGEGGGKGDGAVGSDPAFI